MKFQYKEKKNSLKEISGGKDEIMPFIAIRMDLETIIVSDVSQTVKDERVSSESMKTQHIDLKEIIKYRLFKYEKQK